MIWGFLIGNFNIKCPDFSGCQFHLHIYNLIKHICKLILHMFKFVLKYDMGLFNLFSNLMFHVCNLTPMLPRHGQQHIPPPTMALSPRRRQHYHTVAANAIPPTTLLLPRHRQQQQHYPTASNNAIPSTPQTLSRRRCQRYPTDDTVAAPPPPTTTTLSC